MKEVQISIGMFSIITQIPKKRLHSYDKRGILTPYLRDNLTGYRYYSFTQIDRGIKIRTLDEMNFTYSEMIKFLDLDHLTYRTQINALLQNKLQETQCEIEKLKKIEATLSNPFDNILKGELNSPTLKIIPPMKVLSKRRSGTYSKTITELIDELSRELDHPVNIEHFVKRTGPIMFVCHDEGYVKLNADIEVAIPISGKFTHFSKDSRVYTIPKMKVLSYLHVGSYFSLHNSYRLVAEYMSKNGLEMVSADREIYLKFDPHLPEDEYLTEIQMPIEIL